MKYCDSILGFLSEYEDHRLYKSGREGLFFQTYPAIFLYGRLGEKTLIHELAHCWHLYGSSLGSVFHYWSNATSRAINECIKDDSGNSVPNQASAIKPFAKNKNVITWFNNLKLFHLFKHGFFLPENKLPFATFPTNKEFINAFHEHIDSARRQVSEFDVLSLEASRHPLYYKEKRQRVFLSHLASRSNDIINLMHNSFEGFDYNFNPLVKANVLSSDDLLEDYAKLVELIYVYGGLDTTKHESICDDLLNDKHNGESFRLFHKRFRYLSDPISCIVNYIAIIEISLLSPIHPLLFFKNQYTIEDVYPAHRFNHLITSLTYDICQKAGIKTLHDINSKGFISLLDRMCNENEWPVYSKALNQISSYYSESLSVKAKLGIGDIEQYISKVGQYIIKCKNEGIILDYQLLKNIPVFCFPGSNQIREENLFSLIRHWINEPFGIDLFLNKDYTKTQQRVEMLSEFISPDKIKEVIEKLGMYRFMKENLHINPFLTQEDLENNPQRVYTSLV